jgi:hypothetical protein
MVGAGAKVDKAVADIEDKILATLKKNQEPYGVGSTRWSFGLGVGHPDLATFTEAALRLMQRGLIALNEKSHQYFLTDKGLAECAARKDTLDKLPTYVFPS